FNKILSGNSMRKIKILVILTVIFATNIGLAEEKSGAVDYDVSYKECGRWLFKQDGHTANYLSYNSQYYLGKAICTAKGLVQPAFIAASGALMYHKYGNAAVARMNQNQGAAQAVAVNIPFIMFTFLQKPTLYLLEQVNQVFATFGQIGSFIGQAAGLLPNTNKKINSLEIKYINSKTNYSVDYQDIIEDAIIDAHSKVEHHGGQESLAVNYVLQLDTLLNLPKDIAEVKLDIEKIKTAIFGYNTKTKDAIINFCIRHIANQKKPKPQKTAVFFKGKPGTGKTVAAEKIATALELPFEVISLADVGVNEFIGSSYGQTARPGLLAETLAKVGKKYPNSKNMIILIDEADRAINRDPGLREFLLTLLEPETKSYYNPYFKLDIDVSRVGFILAGNYDIDDEALNNRLQIVNFEGFELECKRSVTLSKLLPELLTAFDQNDSMLKLSASEFSAADMNQINQFIDEDSDVGFRTIKKKLSDFVETKVRCKYFADCLSSSTALQIVSNGKN
ncbi:MAG: AAA family ATPase, partial [bacterium]|nr:AAA family ATPase [bacterium]